MSLIPLRLTIALLVLAPLLELVETLLSPLRDGSTESEMSLIAAHQGRFAISVLFGVAAVVLYLPMFLGLAQACLDRAPVAARIGGWAALVSMAGFMAVRGVQAVQLALVEKHVPAATGATAIDGVTGNAIGAVVLVLFLGGALVGTVALAVAAWRAGLPKPAAVLLGLFQVVDLVAPGHAGSVVSHVLLVVALAWLARGLVQRTTSPRGELVPATTV